MLWVLPQGRDDTGVCSRIQLPDSQDHRVADRHCEEPTGRANARPMTGSATKQSILSLHGYGLLRFARNDGSKRLGCMEIGIGLDPDRCRDNFVIARSQRVARMRAR